MYFINLQLLGRRCIKESECRNYEEKDNVNHKMYWKPFKGQCIQECPPGYIEAENDKHICKECMGKCPKSKYIYIYYLYVFQLT